MADPTYRLRLTRWKNDQRAGRPVPWVTTGATFAADDLATAAAQYVAWREQRRATHEPTGTTPGHGPFVQTPDLPVVSMRQDGTRTIIDVDGSSSWLAELEPIPPT